MLEKELLCIRWFWLAVPPRALYRARYDHAREHFSKLMLLFGIPKGSWLSGTIDCFKPGVAASRHSATVFHPSLRSQLCHAALTLTQTCAIDSNELLKAPMVRERTPRLSMVFSRPRPARHLPTDPAFALLGLLLAFLQARVASSDSS